MRSSPYNFISCYPVRYRVYFWLAIKRAIFFFVNRLLWENCFFSIVNRKSRIKRFHFQKFSSVEVCWQEHNLENLLINLLMTSIQYDSRYQNEKSCAWTRRITIWNITITDRFAMTIIRDFSDVGFQNSGFSLVCVFCVVILYQYEKCKIRTDSDQVNWFHYFLVCLLLALASSDPYEVTWIIIGDCSGLFWTDSDDRNEIEIKFVFKWSTTS